MNKILEVKFGSALYGTSTENSDLDLKGIYLPTAREIVLGTYKPTISTTRPKQPFERNKKDDVDIEIFSLDRFLELLIQGQTVALDLLFHPEFSQHWILEKIYKNREELLNRNINAFVGYARQQAAKYGVKGFRVAALRSTLDFLAGFSDYVKLKEIKSELDEFVVPRDLNAFILDSSNELLIKYTNCRGPNGEPCEHLEVCNRKLPLHCTVKHAKEVFGKIFANYGARALLAESNEGIDFKALSHAVRVNSEAKELLETTFITFPRPDRELLLQIKTGKLDYSVVAEIIEKGLAELQETSKNSKLREAPNKEWADDLVYNVYSRIIKNDRLQ